MGAQAKIINMLLYDGSLPEMVLSRTFAESEAGYKVYSVSLL